MKHRVSFLALCMALVAGLAAQASQTESVKVQSAGGLRTATFQTPQGSIRVNLPDDLSAGDTISGVVLAEPAGQTDEERTRNTGELNGYVIEIKDTRTPIRDRVLRFQVPKAGDGATNFIALTVKDRGGREAGKTQIPVLPTPRTPRPPEPAPGDFYLPTIGQTGRPVQIGGPFDGDFSTTTVKVDGGEISKLAESPRKLIVESPRNIVGSAQLEVKEGRTVAKGEYRNLAINLTAPKTNLLRGETTTLTVEVQGLRGLREDAPITIQNGSPEVVRIEGGDEQAFVIHPEDAPPSGTFRTTRTVTGVRPGGFQVQATVRRPGVPAYSCCEKDIAVAAAASSAETSLVNAKTRRRVVVKTQIKIRFACDTRADDCIGKVEAEVADQPLQLNAATGNYDVNPIGAPTFESDFIKQKCDGKKHVGVVTVIWDATFPGADPVKGTLRLKLTVPVAKGAVKHTYSTDVDAAGAVATAGNSTLESTPEPAKPPDYSCCEKNILLKGQSQVGKAQTSLVNNGTRRRVAVQVQFPITFSCDLVKNQDCIGKVMFEIQDQPQQLNPLTKQYTTKPAASSIQADWAKDNCDGKGKHKAVITASWEATYPGIQEVRGTLKLKLTVPPLKGNVNHTYTVDIEASGNVVKPSEPKLEPAK